MRRRFAVTLAAVILAAAASWAQPQSVSLEFKGAPGMQLSYDNRVSMEMEMAAPIPAGSSDMLLVRPKFAGHAVTVLRVTDVVDNGDLTFAVRVESFDLSIDIADLHARLGIHGQGDNPPQLIKLPELPIQAVISKRGKVIAIRGLDKLIPPIPGPTGQKIDLGQYASKLVSEFAQPVFPDEPVSVGDFWEWKTVIDPTQVMESLGVPIPPEAKQQMASMQFPLHARSTLVGFESVDGVECAKIEMTTPWQLTMPMTSPKGETTNLRESGATKVTTWFDHAAGRKVRELTDFSLDMEVTSGSSMLTKMTMKGNLETRLR